MKKVKDLKRDGFWYRHNDEFFWIRRVNKIGPCEDYAISKAKDLGDMKGEYVGRATWDLFEGMDFYSIAPYTTDDMKAIWEQFVNTLLTAEFMNEKGKKR